MFKVVNEKKDEEDIEIKCVTNKIKTDIKQAPTLKNSQLPCPQATKSCPTKFYSSIRKFTCPDFTEAG